MIELSYKDQDAMTWLSWSAAIVQAIAWPVASVAIAALLRGQLTTLIGNIRKFSWGDKSVDFAEKLDQVEKVSEAEGSISTKAGESITQPATRRFEALLAISPAAAVIDAWIPVEQFIDKLHGMMFPDRKGYDSPAMKLSRLNFPQPTFQTFALLSSLRNEAAHGANISPVDAYRFQNQVAWMLTVFEKRLAELQATPPEEAAGDT